MRTLRQVCQRAIMLAGTLWLMANGMVFRPIGLPEMDGIPAPAVVRAQTSDSIEDLKQKQEDIETERSNIQQERDRLKKLEGSAQEELSGLKTNIQVTTRQIQDNEYRLQLADKRLKELQTDLEAAERSYQERQVATVARLQFLQRQQDSQGWAVLLKSENLNDFLDRRHQLKLVYQSDRNILEDLQGAATDIKTQTLSVEQQKNEIALIRQELLAQKHEFSAQAKTQQGLIQRLKDDRQALEAAESQLAKDSEAVAVLIREKIEAARKRDQSAVIRGTGQFSYPLDAVITSLFGSRIHPILGYQRFHAGIDFGATYGTAIRSADAGTVIFSGWYGGYGQAVIIDHGGGLTSLYAHASDLFVAEGQGVQRGQPIAAVGSTGLSTGPHLHFEVRQNGNPVDPMGYL